MPERPQLHMKVEARAKVTVLKAGTPEALAAEQAEKEREQRERDRG